MPEPIVTLNEESLKSDLRELVRKTVEDTLNGLLEAEADDLVGAGLREGFVQEGLMSDSSSKTLHPKNGNRLLLNGNFWLLAHTYWS